MTITIALAGKGGSGKTTLVPSLLAALTADRLDERRLIVDVDPHQSLTGLLGHAGCPTVGQLRSQYERDLISGAALREDETRETFLEARMGTQAILAMPGYDFLSLGQWELPGSQCTPNRVLSRALILCLARYDVALLDNEAGVEHLGRYAAVPLDALIIVATPERMSLDVARRIHATAQQRPHPPRMLALLLNRLRASDRDRPHVQDAVAAFAQAGLPLLGTVSEAEDEPHTLRADHPWHAQVAPVWARLIGQVRARTLRFGLVRPPAPQPERTAP